jgi:endonuclease YncB( thermonuclease family)
MIINLLKSSLITLILILSTTIALAKDPIRTIEGIVSKVSDGDTVHVTDPKGTKVKVRLYGIDAPETEKSNKRTGHVSKPGQPYGEEAYQTLYKKINRKTVKLDIMDIDQYKRSVGIVYLNGKNINQEMVAEGYAWAYRQYLDRPHASEYIQAEDQARSKRLGLWQQNNPQPPWEFRKSLKKGKHGRAAW